MENIEDVEGSNEQFFAKLLVPLPVRLRLAGLSPEEVLAHFDPEQRFAGLSPEEVLAHFDPEARLAGLDPEQRLAGLDSMALVRLQEAIRKKLDGSE